jgi:tetratricopeptide (TPR) repeat protein
VPDHAARGRQVCEQTLGLYHVLDREDWQQDPQWQRLAADDRLRLAEDTRELLLLLAWSRVQCGQSGPLAPRADAVSRGETASLADALRGALILLDRADAIEGLEPSPALARDRASYLEQLGDTEAARQAREAAERLEPVSARDYYQLAMTDSRRGDCARAIEDLDRATALNPRHYWSWVQKGICHYELRRYALAAADFGVCIGLWPEFAWGYFNRGRSLDVNGQWDEAVTDYTEAIRRDPAFLLAYESRGVAYVSLGHYEAALDDFDRAAALGSDHPSMLAGRGVAREALGRHDEADAAFEAALARPELTGEDRVHVLSLYGSAVKDRLPKKAREAFAEVLRLSPDNPRALYSMAALLMNDKRDVEEALSYFDRVIQLSPEFAEARQYRGILLARLGKFEAAGEDINWCIQREPQSGAPLYAASCVSALLAKQWAAVKGDPVARAQAEAAVNQTLGFLQKALALGFGRDKAGTDPDLEGIRRDPRFAQLLKR